MQKRIFATATLAFVILAASAQVAQKEEPPKPPPPPKPAVKIVKDLPPPPPPPSQPPAPDAPPPPPSADLAQLPDDFEAFMKRNPSIKGVGWRNDEMIIRLKSGKEEHYNLNDVASKKEAEAKYGELPQAPPPPPPPPAPPRAPKQKRTLS